MRAMKPTIAKVVVRIVGTLFGLLGLGMLGFDLRLFYRSVAERNGWSIMFMTIALMTIIYLIYVAYLVWLRFSPRAVRHVCGALGFCVLAFLVPNRAPEAPWAVFAFVGCLVVIYIGYRIASVCLCRLLFPENVPGVQA